MVLIALRIHCVLKQNYEYACECNFSKAQTKEEKKNNTYTANNVFNVAKLLLYMHFYSC